MAEKVVGRPTNGISEEGRDSENKDFREVIEHLRRVIEEDSKSDDSTE